MAAPYVPIDCSVHDQLEVHALRGDLLDVEFLAPDGRPGRLDGVRLVTWRSRGGEEVGVFVADDGAETVIRLDRLRTVEDRRTSRRTSLPSRPCAD